MKNVRNRAVAILMALVAFSLSSIAMPKGHFLALNTSTPVLDSLPTVCLQTQSVNLLSYVRSGTGSFSGPGVSANSFDPTAAGAGRHVLTFQYYDSANQVSAVFRPSIWVYPVPVFVRFDNSCAPGSAVAEVSDLAIYSIDWYRNNQLLKEKPISYAENGDLLLSGLGGVNYDMCIDGFGNRYFSSGQDRVIRHSPGQQGYNIVAGGNGRGSNLDQLNESVGVAVDNAGNVFVADLSNNRIVRWSPGASTGVVVAGSINGTSGNGLTQLNRPYHIKYDNTGRLYVSDRDNNRIVSYPSSISTTNTPLMGTIVAGTSANIQLNGPNTLFIDSLTNMMYVVDNYSNTRIIQYNLSASNIANSGIVVAGGNGLGQGLNQLSSHIGGIYVSNGALFIADMNGERILYWRIGAEKGQVIAGSRGYGSQLNRVSRPTAVRIDNNGNLEYVDRDFSRLVRFSANSLKSDTLEFTEAGVYRAEFKRFGISCVSASADFTINKPIAQISSSTGATVCEGDTTTLSTPALAGYVYQWFKDGLQIAGAVASSLTAFEPGVYHVEVSDSNACSRTSESMRIWPKPQATITADGLCLGSELRTNVPDSNVYQIDWFRNNQLFSSTIRKYAEYGEVIVGSGASQGSLSFSGGIGGFYAHTDGMLYIIDNDQRRIIRYDPKTQQHQTVAGGNGLGTSRTQFGSNISGVFVTFNGDVYVSDANNHRVMRWSPGATQGVIVAGSDSTSGTALNRLWNPQGIFVDAGGNLFIADQGNHRVVRWAPGATSGVLVAGGSQGAGLNQLSNPRSVFVTPEGILYVADLSNYRILRFSSGSTTGVLVAGGNGQGSGLNQLNSPSGLQVDRMGNIYVADQSYHRIVRWKPNSAGGELVVGDGQRGSDLNRVGGPWGVLLTPEMDLLVLNNNSQWGGIPNRITRFKLGELGLDSIAPTASGTYYAKFTTKQGCSNVSQSHVINAPEVALASSKGFDVCEDDTTQLSTIQNASYTYKWFRDGAQIAGATTNTLNAFTPGVYYVEVLDSLSCSKASQSMRIWPKPQAFIMADGLCLGSELKTNVPDSDVIHIDWYRNNQVIKQVSRGYNSSGEFPLGNSNPMLSQVEDFHIHFDGSIYLSRSDEVIRYFPNTNQIIVVAGRNGNGSALNQLNNPKGIFVTQNGDVYITDFGNHRVVRWSPGANQGIVVAGFTGMQGSALNRLNYPRDVFVDLAGNIFISDQNNHRVIKWGLGALQGEVVAGTTGQMGDLVTHLNSPSGIFVTPDGLLYVSDYYNHRVMRYSPGSTVGTMVAGSGQQGTLLNQLFRPFDVFVDDRKNVYVSDEENYRLVLWRPGAATGELIVGGTEVNQPKALKLGYDKSLFVCTTYSGVLKRFTLDSLTADVLVANEEGSYHFVMFTKQGCENHSNTETFNAPEVGLSSSLGRNVCVGDTTLLHTFYDSSYTYTWYRDATQIGGALSSSLTAFEPGSYHVEVTDSNGCVSISKSIRIWPMPATNLMADGICVGSKLISSVPDSQVIEVAWLKNNQVVKSLKAPFEASGRPHIGYFNGISFNQFEILSSGIGDVFVDQKGDIYVLAATNQYQGHGVIKYTQVSNGFSLVAGGNGAGSLLNQIGSFNGASIGGLFVSENGDIYVADRTNHRVVKWAPGATQGIVVAGGNGSGSGLNQLYIPQSVYVNAFGDVFVVDQLNHRVVRWAPGASTGVIVAGGNGPGTALNQLNNPRFITFNESGDFFVSDQNNHRVMKYSLGQSIGVIVAGGNGAGSALNQLNQPNGIEVDKSGNIYIADRFNNRIIRWASGAIAGEIVAGFNLGASIMGLNRIALPVGLRLTSDYRLFITSLDTLPVNNNPNRVMSFNMKKLTSDSIIAESGGDYQVRFTGFSGCSNFSQILPIIEPNISFPSFLNVCLFDEKFHLNMATPVGGAYFGAGVDTGYFHPDVAGVGSHMIYYLFVDSNGCSKLDSQTIQVVPEPIVGIDTLGSMDLCQGEIVTLEAPLTAGQTYQWYRNGVLIPQATQRSYTVRDSVSAQYHVMVTRNICERSSDTLMVIVRPKPVVTIANPGASTICQGDSVILQAASDTDVSYQWYRNGQLLAGSTQSSLVANQTGNYICKVVKANGCADTSNTLSLTVLDYPIAQITPVNATAVCSGQAVILNANQGTGLTHRWFRNGVLIAGATSASYQATQSGDYTVEVKRQQLCATVSAPVTVVINPLPQIAIQVAQGGNFCSGDSIQINAQSTSQVLRYAWFRNGQLLPSDSTGTFFARLPGFYHARVFDTAGCDKASDSVQVGYFDPPFANENICAISVDTLTGRNVVVWEKTANVRTAAYNIYREGVVTGQYINIGRVPFDSMSTFTDTTANPLSQSFRYRIAVVDSCGFESARSAVHRTIHLSSNVGVNNEVNLYWTAYEGVPVPTHRILRSVNGGPFVQIAQVSGTTFTYTDLTPPQGAKNYLIEIEIPGGCSPTGLRTSGQRVSTNFTSIRSNRVAVGQGVFVRNVRWNEPSLYPNPTSGKLYLKLGADLSDRQFEVYDARGRLVRRVTVESREEPHEFDFSMEADGVYTIRSVNSEWKSRFVISK